MSEEKMGIKEVVGGLVVWGLLGWGGWTIWGAMSAPEVADAEPEVVAVAASEDVLLMDGGPTVEVEQGADLNANEMEVPEEDPREASTPTEVLDQHEGLDLAGYTDLSRESRRQIIHAMAERAGIPPEGRAGFVTCLGDHAPQKSPDLLVSDVFGWCQMEAQYNPDRFAERFNELTAPDLTAQATTQCRALVRNRLDSPGSADFPWVADGLREMPRQRYVINSHVDAENTFGAEVRLRYRCDIQHDGGDAMALSSWIVRAVDLRQR